MSSANQGPSSPSRSPEKTIRRGKPVRRLTRWLFGGAVTVAFAGALAWFLAAQSAKARANSDSARRKGLPMPVRTERVVEKTYSRTGGATGITAASQSAIIHLAAAAAGSDRHLVVRSINVKEGDFVKQGQVLIEFDDTTCRLTCEQRKRTCEAEEAEFKAMTELRRQGAASAFQLEEARTNYEIALLDWKIAEHDLATCKIASPLDGFVEKFEAIPGEQVDVTLEITQVHKLDPVHLRVDLPQEQIGDVALGMQAAVVLDSFPQDTFVGKVISISPEVDSETRVLPVVVEIPNPQYRIKAGVSGFARFRSEKTGILVPSTAVIQIDTKAMVFVVEGDHAHMRQIQTGGLVEPGMREVTSGLLPGDEVVIYGQQQLKDNDRVNVDWRMWARR
jgi:membrane fusion protein (multidrug efflux system)